MSSRFMELELGLALPNHDLNSCSNRMEPQAQKRRELRKYSHGEEEEEVDSKNLSLLLWSGGPGQEDNAPNNLHADDEENEEEDEEIIGWPPIRKELLHHHHGGRVVVAAARNYMYVKVKMEGVAIGRKIDLRLYHSYQALTDSLVNMFARYIKNRSGSNRNYTILYQDKEGDWMLAGDVPWETFVESVQRMEIRRNGS